ncbi:hypothetical protein AAMO2058_001352400 [Amorphochlora amoebiformis]
MDPRLASSGGVKRGRPGADKEELSSNKRVKPAPLDLDIKLPLSDPLFFKIINHARIKTLPPNWLAQLVVVSLESVPSPTADLLPAPSLLHHYIDLYHKPADPRNLKKEKKKGGLDVRVPALSARQRCVLAYASFGRVISRKSEIFLAGPQARKFRFSIIAKLAANILTDTETDEIILDYVARDWKNRLPLASELAYTLLTASQPEDAKDERKRRYNRLCALVLGRMVKSSSTDALFPRFVLDLPVIPDIAIHLAKDYCETGTKLRRWAGLEALRDLAVLRLSHRWKAIGILIEYMTASNDDLRHDAIKVAVSSLLEIESLRALIYSHAHTQVEEAVKISHQPIADPKSKMKAKDIKPKPEDEKVQAISPQERSRLIKLKIDLEFAICEKHPEECKFLLEQSAKGTIPLRIAFGMKVKKLIRSIGIDNEKLYGVMKACPEGGEDIMYLFINELASIQITPRLFQVAWGLFEWSKNSLYDFNCGRFLVPVISALNKGLVLRELGRLLHLPSRKMARRAINALSKADTASKFKPSELLIALHELTSMQGNKSHSFLDMLRHVIHNECLQRGDIYTQEELAVALSQMASISPIPKLYMWTLLQVLRKYPKTVGFAMQQLTTLISRRVWEDAELWIGFLKCANENQPKSFPVLLQLPPQQLQDALSTHKSIREPLRAFAEANKALLRRPKVLEILGIQR